MSYELYYWPGIQGRGEFVRLALEEAGADYVDVAREKRKGMGMQAMLRLMDDPTLAQLPYAPPFLRSGEQVIGQTANILLFLGARHNLAPQDEAGRLWVHQLQLTIADLLTEVHETHHPIASSLYYEEQRNEALRRATDFTQSRLPKFFHYFEAVLARQPQDAWLAGAAISYADLSLFQMVEGLRYAFPETMHALQDAYPRIHAVHARVLERPRIAAYLASPRRIPFNEEGIFRAYPELDLGAE